jgi:peptide chain release factor 3
MRRPGSGRTTIGSTCSAVAPGAGDPVTSPSSEAARRRTFAIISHPDAGKTTLTEKFLLYGGALSGTAGAVKARGDRRSATSDWMELEQQRGISITSTVLQFPYRDCVVNLLDTPGHRDFSEDTYRVLAAADAAVMVLDAAKGIEPQTLKLFEVCKARQMPLLTFINKWDRPGLDALELLDQIEAKIGVTAAPVTWPVGIAGDFRGVVDRGSGDFIRFTRTARGATEAPEEVVDPERALAEEGDAWANALEETELLSTMGLDHDHELFLGGELSPTFFGSALTNFGVRLLLDAVIDLAPPAVVRTDDAGVARDLDAPFSGLVFKVQANMDKAHRDRIAFVRVCSGRFERGMVVTHGTTGKPFATKYAHTVNGSERETLDEAFPGDVIGLVNANDVRVGDTLWLDEPVTFERIPSFAPEHFSVARVRDTGRFKQFRKGIAQLDEEGVVQVLRDPELGDQAPVLAAVGPMQFEVAVHRLENEFGAPVELSPTSYTVARRTDAASASALRAMRGVDVLARADGTLIAVFESTYWLDRLAADHPELLLETLVAGDLASSVG